jgi:DNA repair protein RadC
LLSIGGVEQAETVAAALISEFGTLRRVMTAPTRRLMPIVSDSKSKRLLELYRRALVIALRPEPGRTSIKDWRELNAYFAMTLGAEPIERFHILHLDAHNRLIVDDDWSRGTIDEAPVYVREVLRRALEVGAAALLLVHNHPSGDTSPSRADIDLTRSLQKACKSVGIGVHDHVIVTAMGSASMRALDLI